MLHLHLLSISHPFHFHLLEKILREAINLLEGKEGTAAMTTHCAQSRLYVKPFQASIQTLVC